MPDECKGCGNVSAETVTGCSVYTYNIDWVKRRGGCPIPERFIKTQKIKVNPLKASKRSRG